MAYRLLLCISVLLAGCSRGPDWYPVPPQRTPQDASASGRAGRFIEMNSPNADAHLLRDVSRYVEGGVWRWAGPHPQLRFYVASASGLKFSMDFSIAESVFKETGPITLTILINGQPLDKAVFSKTGDHHYEKPVPEALLQAGQDNLVEIEPDKVWTSKEDGAKLSILLIRAGFVE